MRPLDPSVSAAPGLAQLCSLAYIKLPNLEEDFGQEAAEYLSELTLSSGKEFRAMVEEKDTTGGKVKGQGTGPIIAVTLVAVDSEISVNAAMLQVFITTDSCLKYYCLKYTYNHKTHHSEHFVFIWYFQEGLARMEKRNRWDRTARKQALDNLEMFQGEARTARRGMWQYGDIQSDDEDTAPPQRKAGGGRGK